MLHRLSSHYQKEIAFSLLYIFMLSGIVIAKAQSNVINTIENNGFNSHLSSNYSKKANTHFSSYVDEKDKGKDKKNQKSTAVSQNFSGNQQRKFEKVDIDGPSQPEMTSFKSMNSDNLVSPFTGDFSYNIPLLDVGGYPVNAFYNSGITSEQDASWLGLGWNINPGTITRNMRGLPDDFNGTDKVIKTQSFKDDKTLGLTTGANIKFVGFPQLNLAANWGLSWNNKLGIAAEAGINAELSVGSKSSDSKTFKLTTSASLNSSSRGGASYSPSIGLSIQGLQGLAGCFNGNYGAGYNYSSRMGLTSSHISISKSIFTYENLSFGYPTIVPTINKPLTHCNYGIDLSSGSEFYGINGHFKLHGYYSNIFIADEDKISYHSAYGMLNLQEGQNDKNALLDFNRSNDGVYTPNSPAIALPIYTYDIFTINGEGTGGSFRAYRGDIGHMRDANVRTKENALGLGLDFGFGNMLHLGSDLNFIYSPTEAGDWNTNNMATSTFAFQKSDSTYQSVYFKNPSEKTIPDQIFQQKMANEDLIRLKLGNTGSANPMLMSKIIRYDALKNRLDENDIKDLDTKKLNRDKRTQVISFLTAEESERIGMNSKLYSYNSQGVFQNHIIYSSGCNKYGIDSFYRNHDLNHSAGNSNPEILGNETIAFRHQHHISEIDVLGSDGKKYVYGLPVYNKKQYNVSFSVDQDQQRSLTRADYQNGDNDVQNKRGRDWFLEKEEIPAYPHSFLLTELVSPNYVDVTGNGISEDDMGDAVKFNYSKFDDYKWRTPVGDHSASFSNGLKTDEKDNKAHYVYGERESWYLYSIESKNLVARFYVKSDRKDGRPVLDENGVLDLSSSKGMKRLDKISLFSKGELSKYGDNAKPIKTIRFFQSYKLCKNQPIANEFSTNIEIGQGKLTLDSIWISFNGNDSKPKSRYVFYYPADNNPNYSFDQSDRWGNYKPSSDNPNSISNEDYPYSIQNKSKADKNISAWTLNKIQLPSGGIINIDYESDSYSYVQSKKAACMFEILGFGIGETLPDVNERKKLYSNGGIENDHIFIELPFPINSLDGKKEFASRYLEDIKQLYLKLAVTMPVGNGLSGISGEELISVYADIDGENYGLVSPNVAWIKVKDIGTGHTSMVQSVWQFLTRQLPGKAYKGYDLSEQNNLTSIVIAMGSMISSIGTLFNGEMNKLKSDLKCQLIVPERSFIRLTEPNRSKLGGGIRVKRIEISDSWNKMTGQLKSTYGQEYKYTTKEIINGKQETISSGVASWEPAIGGDENPYKEIMRYMDHNKGGPYDMGAIEMPLGEMLYPSPMIGYSRIEVLSIHRDTVKNLPTRQVTEFFTNKDFPYKSSCTDLVGDANTRFDPNKIIRILKIDMMKSVAQSQGFLVETNDMNGKEKSFSIYSAIDSIHPIYYRENFYNTKKYTDKTYGFNHFMPVISKADGKVDTVIMGRDIEIMTDFRQHHSETFTSSLSINFDAFIVGFFPIPLLNILPPYTREGTMYRSAALLKVVNHYGILDSVFVVDKGSKVSTKNLVYDAETGNVLLTRTQNEHNKSIYKFNYPAHWAYSGMGLAYKNIDAVYSGLEFKHGILTNPPSGFFNVLESGDELYVLDKNDQPLKSEWPCDSILNKNNPWDTLGKSKTNRIWAVNTLKTGSTNSEWVFMDEQGNPYNAAVFNGDGATIRIVRSGKRNMLDQSVGSVTSMNNPIVRGKITFDDSTGIIQTSAATFKDNWKVDNSFYNVKLIKDSLVYARVHRDDFISSNFLNITWKHDWNISSTGVTRTDILKSLDSNNSMPLYRSFESYNLSSNIRYNLEDKRASFLLYSYDRIPSNSMLYKAKLSLYSHENFPLFNGSIFPSAKHPGLHGETQKNNLNLAYINALMGNWYYGTNPDPWIDDYFRVGTRNLSINKGIVPNDITSWNNFYYEVGKPDTRIDITRTLSESFGTILGRQHKLGLKLKLDIEDTEFKPGNQFRCFWSPNALTTSNSPDSFASPILSYYHYEWGNTDMQNEFSYDSSVNLMLKKYIGKILSSNCKSKFERKAINPYVEGILGNWRIDSSYIYYGQRDETDPTTVHIDTRTAGKIKGYKNFWNLPPVSNNSQEKFMTRNFQASDAWLWKSTITQYNRRGYEVENTDPLGRFNSGLYGYNQQLPIAITNNSRLRESLFDGFEDYDYETSSNCISCKSRRSFNFSKSIISLIDSTQKHTGRFSLRLDTGQNLKIIAPVVDLVSANKNYGLKIQNKTIGYTDQVLSSNGTNGRGLLVSWYNHSRSFLPLEPPQYNSQYSYISGDIKVVSPIQGINSNFFSVRWVGKIQAPVTGVYKIKPAYLDDGYRIIINGVQLSSSIQWVNGCGNLQESFGIQMTIGQVYNIEICYYDWNGNNRFELNWKRPDQNIFTPIPTNYLYAPSANNFQQVISSQKTCYRLDSSQIIGNALTDTFSLIQGKRMLLGAWVKVGDNNCCFPLSYVDSNNMIKIKFINNDNTISEVPDFHPTGPVIEGWQRYESDFEIPNTAIQVEVSLNNTSNNDNVYFDDLRIHPYNANMKSFVYHSGNLRLMAELDENNYGSFYEYDDDGTLARVKKETVLGIKTITETRSSNQKKNID